MNAMKSLEIAHPQSASRPQFGAWIMLTAAAFAASVGVWFPSSSIVGWLLASVALIALGVLLADLRARLPTQNLIAISVIFIGTERFLPQLLDRNRSPLFT